MLQHTINRLLSQQVQAVLATTDKTHGIPLMHLMAYAFSTALDEIYLASRRSTRKVDNLLLQPSVSMLWDNRSGSIQDHIDGFTLLAIAEATVIEDADTQQLSLMREALLLKNPTLAPLFALPDCCLIKLVVREYQYTEAYQATEIWQPS